MSIGTIDLGSYATFDRGRMAPAAAPPSKPNVDDDPIVVAAVAERAAAEAAGAEFHRRLGTGVEVTPAEMRAVTDRIELAQRREESARARAVEQFEQAIGAELLAVRDGLAAIAAHAPSANARRWRCVPPPTRQRAA